MGTVLLAERCRWGRTIDKKTVAVHGKLCEPTPLIRILIVTEGGIYSCHWAQMVNIRLSVYPRISTSVFRVYVVQETSPKLRMHS